MAINSLALAQKLTTELDKLFVQKAKTGFSLITPRAKFVGAGTVLLPDVAFSGLGDYDRDTGFPDGSITVANTPYELTMDRGRSFQLDAQDYDETGIPGLAGQVMGEFIRTKVVPETDAYVLSKLSKLAATKSHTVAVGASSTLDADIYKMLIDAILGVQDAAGSDEELVAFVDSTVFSAIMNSEVLSKTLVASEFKHGDINLIVKSVNGVPILHVPSARMKTAYTFYDGTSNPGDPAPDERPGGFVSTADANNIGLIVMPKKPRRLFAKPKRYVYGHLTRTNMLMLGNSSTVYTMTCLLKRATRILFTLTHISRHDTLIRKE